MLDSIEGEGGTGYFFQLFFTWSECDDLKIYSRVHLVFSLLSRYHYTLLVLSEQFPRMRVKAGFSIKHA